MFSLFYPLVTVKTGKSLSGVVIFVGKFSVVQFVMDKTRSEIKYIFSGRYRDQCGGSKEGYELPVLTICCGLGQIGYRGHGAPQMGLADASPHFSSKRESEEGERDL